MECQTVFLRYKLQIRPNEYDWEHETHSTGNADRYRGVNERGVILHSKKQTIKSHTCLRPNDQQRDIILSYNFCLWFRAPLIYIIIAQRNATQSSLPIILQVHSTHSPHPSSGVHKTVNYSLRNFSYFCASTSLQSGQWPRWREVDACRANLQKNK